VVWTGFDARKQIVQALEEQGYLEKVEPYKHAVGHCQRCHTVVEPMLSDQWFVKLTAMADEAKRVVETGEVQIIPERWIKVYQDWMDNIRDWCISRQIWWGTAFLFIPVKNADTCLPVKRKQ